MTESLRLRISSLGDDELVRLLTVEAGQYREEALDLARAEASRRGLEVQAAPPSPAPAGPDLGNALRAFGQGVASQFSPSRFAAAGKAVVCPHCDGDSFEEQSAVVNTRGLTLVGLDWLDKGATVLACERCGLIQWFRIAPVRVAD